MSERETPDFMSVDSFSQLPFIRPAPPSRDKSSTSPTAATSSIRLFGIDFTHEPDATEDDQPSPKPNTSSGSNDNGGSAGGTAGSGGDSSRKFECHYCCRNFPTSQALGGHQNAHKRERQHAKRAHLQSALAAAHHHHQLLGGATDGHIYGLLSYHRLDSMASATRFGISHAFEPPFHSPYYHPWNSTSPLVGPRFYGAGSGAVSQPIGNFPVPGTWRTPAVQGGGWLPPMQDDRPTILPLLGGNESRVMGSMVGADSHGGGSGLATGSPSSSSSAAGGLVYETATAGVQDHLSLDLHL